MSESSPSFHEEPSNQESPEAAFDEFVPFEKATERWRTLQHAITQEYASSGAVSETTLFNVLAGNTLMEIGARQYYSQFPDAAAAIGFAGPENDQKIKDLQQMTRDAHTHHPTPALRTRFQLFIDNANTELSKSEAGSNTNPEKIKQLRAAVEAYDYCNRYFIAEVPSDA